MLTNYHMASNDGGYTSRLEHAYTSKMAASGKNLIDPSDVVTTTEDSFVREANVKLRKFLLLKTYFLLPVLPSKV